MELPSKPGYQPIEGNSILLGDDDDTHDEEEQQLPPQPNGGGGYSDIPSTTNDANDFYSDTPSMPTISYSDSPSVPTSSYSDNPTSATTTTPPAFAPYSDDPISNGTSTPTKAHDSNGIVRHQVQFPRGFLDDDADDADDDMWKGMDFTKGMGSGRRRAVKNCYWLSGGILIGIILTTMISGMSKEDCSAELPPVVTPAEDEESSPVVAPAGEGESSETLPVAIDAEDTGSSGSLSSISHPLATRKLHVTTWNIAAVNNNPFEYWMTIADRPEYTKLMESMEGVVEDPGEYDVTVLELFREDRFDELDTAMKEKAGWDSVRSIWDDDLKHRKTISEFLKDPQLGLKRLMSMPDRVTNTIPLHEHKHKDDKEDKKHNAVKCRPTVINQYDGDLSNLKRWWKQWMHFMFEEEITVPEEGSDEGKTVVPFQLLKPIAKAKYPAISEEEEALSLPLQTLYCAIFDAILVHLMNTVSKAEVWQPLRQKIVESLILEKVDHTMYIVKTQYVDSDILTLQEVSSSFVQMARKNVMHGKFHISTPADFDPSRNQNSVIFLRKDTFEEVEEVTSFVMDELGDSDLVANGDLLVVKATEKESGAPFIVASFHGDTNGQATEPVLAALMKTVGDKFEHHQVIFGLDANTYENGSDKLEAVESFGEAYAKAELSSCWGDAPQPQNYTTYNARTYLQPQLNKACKASEKRTCGDVNPKDHILFYKGVYEVTRTFKDNTGVQLYQEDMPFPTLGFPSDHGLVSTILTPTGEGQAVPGAEGSGDDDEDANNDRDDEDGEEEEEDGDER